MIANETDLTVLTMRGSISQLQEPQKEIAQLYERDVTKTIDDIMSEIKEKYPDYKAEFTVAVVIGLMESLNKVHRNFEQ